MHGARRREVGQQRVRNLRDSVDEDEVEEQLQGRDPDLVLLLK